MKKAINHFEKVFEAFTEKITAGLGHPFAFLVAIVIAAAWISIDFIYSSSWHTVLNDLLLAFTFLMVFIIQKTQNKFSTVIHVKLNELVASHENASNRLINAEDMTEKELRKLAAHYETLSASLGNKETLITSTSIEQVIDEIKEDIEEKEDEEKST